MFVVLNPQDTPIRRVVARVVTDGVEIIPHRQVDVKTNDLVDRVPPVSDGPEAK